MTLGMRIKELRTKQALSQPELAEKIGIEQSYLSKLENDKSIPSDEMLQGVLDAFNISLADLIAPIDVNEHPRLLQIPMIRAFQMATQKHRFNYVRRYLIICAALIVVGGSLLFVGSTKSLFPETAFEYRSLGLVLPSEPEDIFNSWPHLIENNRAVRDKKELEMAKRRDVVTLVSTNYQGEAIKKDVEGGLRYYRYIREFESPRPVNGIFETLGMVILLCGFVGLLLERRYFALQPGA